MNADKNFIFCFMSLKIKNLLYIRLNRKLKKVWERCRENGDGTVAWSRQNFEKCSPPPLPNLDLSFVPRGARRSSWSTCTSLRAVLLHKESQAAAGARGLSNEVRTSDAGTQPSTLIVGREPLGRSETLWLHLKRS